METPKITYASLAACPEIIAISLAEFAWAVIEWGVCQMANLSEICGNAGAKAL